MNDDFETLLSACDGGVAKDALRRAMDWMSPNIEAMECRGDEDCDHCAGLQAQADVLAILRGEKA